MPKIKFSVGHLPQSNGISWFFGATLDHYRGFKRVVGSSTTVELNFGPWYASVEFEGKVKN